MDYLRVLRNTNFTKLWLAQISSQIAQNILIFYLILHVYDLTQGSRFGSSSVGLLLATIGLPAIFLAAYAGIFADYWDRRRILLAVNLIRVVLVGLYITVDDSFGGILILTLVFSSVNQFFIPAEAATVPRLVGKRNLISANSLISLTLFSSLMVGYALAEPINLRFGENGIYWTAMALFGVAALMVALLPSQKPENESAIPPHRLHPLKEGIQNWRLARRKYEVRFGIEQITLVQLVITSLVALAPAAAPRLFHTPLKSASHLLIIPVSLGMIVGLVLVGFLSQRITKVRMILMGFLLTGLGMVLIGIFGWLPGLTAAQNSGGLVARWLEELTIFCLGISNAVVSAVSQTVIQENSLDSDRGKIFGVLNMSINVAGTIPVIILGFLADILQATTIIGLVGVAFLVGYYYYLRILPRRAYSL